MDDTLDVGTILTLVTEFQNFNPDSLVSQQIPTYGDPRGGVAYQSIDWEAAEPLLELFRGVDPGVPMTPGAVIVDVQGDEDDMARLDQTAAQLDTAGFDAEVFESRATDTTTITYGPRGRDAALLLASQLEAVPRMELDEEISGYRVVLSVGTDFAGVRAEALPLEQLPPDLIPTTVPPSTSAPDTSTEGTTDPSAPASTTTTSVPGVVPTDPAKAATCR
jgi:hypothetical protein